MLNSLYLILLARKQSAGKVAAVDLVMPPPPAAAPQLLLSPEQRELGHALGRFTVEHWQVRGLLADPRPSGERIRALWRELDGHLGIAGMTVPTDQGGAGAGVAELAVVAEQLGRALYPSPLLGTLGLAVPLLAADQRHPDRCALLARIAAEGLAVAVAHSDNDVRLAPGGHGEPALTGTLHLVADACEAEQLLLVAEDEGRPTLFAVGLDGPGVRSRRLEALDRARSYAEVRLERAPAISLGAVGQAIDQALDVARVVVAADLLGVSGKALDLAVEHAGQRVQFGRVIGSYQAVKHRCARMLILIEQTRSLVRNAAWCLDASQEDLGGQDPHAASLEALWFAADTAVQVTADLIRVLGGVGFTWEHEAHLYYRRARASSALLGTQISRRDALAASLLPL